MKITVVTASFNQGRFIEKCLASVRAQQGDFSVEHIILDNCSTDTTGEALANYQDVPGAVDVRVFVEPDGGQTAAINKGFSLAKGDVVCWLNTDEWYEDGALAKVADFFASHPEVDVVFGNCDFVDSTGNLVKRKREYFYSKSMLVYYGCFIPSCATFIRRRVIDKGYLLDESLRVCMDFEWYAHMAAAGYKFMHMSISLAKFTWHETNISSTTPHNLRHQDFNRVRLRYGGYKMLPIPFRLFVFSILHYWWTGVRGVLRVLKYLYK
jgi:glycosyltransferase involved in cell wall biosynthesis